MQTPPRMQKYGKYFPFIGIFLLLIFFYSNSRLFYSDEEKNYSEFGNSDLRRLGSLKNAWRPKNFLENRSEFSMKLNFDLWSQRPDLFNWKHSLKMCRSIFQHFSDSSNSTSSANSTKSKSIFESAKKWTVPDAHSDESISNLTSNCSKFRDLVEFPTTAASQEESEFPLAYVFVGARNAAQSLRFFRMIYQPQNAYCITYDNKSNEFYKNVLRRLPTCISEENIFLNENPENIWYADFSILHSVMECLKILLRNHRKIPWRYVQIVSWNDFPLKTNAELVKIFKILNGSQDSSLEPLLTHFWIYNWNFTNGAHDALPNITKPPPNGLAIYKGSYATSMTQEFVEFLFKNPSSIRLYEWINGTKCPEEHYWQTLIHNLHLNPPGGFPGQCLYYYEKQDKLKPFISRFQIWDFDERENKCLGQFTHLSCVYGVEDLKTLTSRFELIAHKMYEDFEPMAMFCLENWFWEKNKDPFLTFDETIYRNLPSVRYQNLKNKEEFFC